MTTHLYETDLETGVTVHTDRRTGVQRHLSGMPSERGNARRGNLAAQLRKLTATVAQPTPNATRTATPTTTTSTTSTIARLARLGIR